MLTLKQISELQTDWSDLRPIEKESIVSILEWEGYGDDEYLDEKITETAYEQFVHYSDAIDYLETFDETILDIAHNYFCAWGYTQETNECDLAHWMLYNELGSFCCEFMTVGDLRKAMEEAEIDYKQL